VIDALVPGVCAALAVVCSVHALVLVGDHRVGVAMRHRLVVGPQAASAHGIRVRLVSLMARVARPLERRFGARVRHRRADRDVLLLLESTTRRLRSGESLRLAIASAAADCSDPVDRALTTAIDTGVPLRSILDTWMIGAASSRVLVGTALRLAADAGGAVAAVFDGVAESLRDRLALDREVEALSSQARASALVLIVAPAVFALLMASVDPRVAALQFTTPIGWACCVVGVALDLLGAWWMSTMISRVR